MVEPRMSRLNAAQKPQRPDWLRAPAPAGENYRDLKALIEGEARAG